MPVLSRRAKVQRGRGRFTQKKGRDNHLEGVAAVGEPEGVGAKVAALVLREEEVHVLIFVLVLRSIKKLPNVEIELTMLRKSLR